MTARLRPELADLPAYTPGKTVPGAIKIASNETVHGPLPSVRAAIEKAAKDAGIDVSVPFRPGRADAFVMDGSILAKNIATSKNPHDFKIVGEVLSVEPIAIMMRKDDPAFKKAVDDSIKAMIKSGDMAKLWDKWFLQPIPPAGAKIGLALNDATKQAWANPNDKPMEEYAKK